MVCDEPTSALVVSVQAQILNLMTSPGCAFHLRCLFAKARCRSEIPALRPAGGSLVACHAVEEDRLPELMRSPACSSASLAPLRA